MRRRVHNTTRRPPMTELQVDELRRALVQCSTDPDLLWALVRDVFTKPELDQAARRLAVVLAIVDGASVNDAAGLLGVPRGTVQHARLWLQHGHGGFKALAAQFGFVLHTETMERKHQSITSRDGANPHPRFATERELLQSGFPGEDIQPYYDRLRAGGELASAEVKRVQQFCYRVEHDEMPHMIAALRVTRARVEEIESALEAFRRVGERWGKPSTHRALLVEEYDLTNRQFHAALWSLLGEPYQTVVRTLAMPAAGPVAVKAVFTQAFVEQSVSVHHLLYDAIYRGEPAKARGYLAHHYVLLGIDAASVVDHDARILVPFPVPEWEAQYRVLPPRRARKGALHRLERRVRSLSAQQRELPSPEPMDEEYRARVAELRTRRTAILGKSDDHHQ